MSTFFGVLSVYLVSNLCLLRYVLRIKDKTLFSNLIQMKCVSKYILCTQCTQLYCSGNRGGGCLCWGVIYFFIVFSIFHIQGVEVIIGPPVLVLALYYFCTREGSQILWLWHDPIVGFLSKGFWEHTYLYLLILYSICGPKWRVFF